MSNPDDSKEYIESGYDKIAIDYLAWTHSRPASIEHRLEIVKRLHKFLGSAEPGGQEPRRRLKMLELGCGAGDPVTLALATHPAMSDVFANDISIKQLHMLRDKLARLGTKAERANVELMHSDMMALDFKAESLDAVLAFYSIIHLPQEEQTEVVSRIYRWLKPGSGYFLVSFGAEESAGVTNENWSGMKSYWSSHGVEKSLKLVEDAGFEIVHREVTNDPEDASFLWVIGRKRSQ